jgi:hypothetical protein
MTDPSLIDNTLPFRLIHSPTQELLEELMAQCRVLMESMQAWTTTGRPGCLDYLEEAKELHNLLRTDIAMAGMEMEFGAIPLHMDSAIYNYRKLTELCAFSCTEAHGDMSAWERALSFQAA